MRLRACDAAVLVLRETDNPAVMWGDGGLLHMIADRAKLKVRSRSWMTEDAVLNTLSKQPGELIAATTLHPHLNRRVRIFYLPEHVPEWVKKQQGL